MSSTLTKELQSSGAINHLRLEQRIRWARNKLIGLEDILDLLDRLHRRERLRVAEFGGMMRHSRVSVCFAVSEQFAQTVQIGQRGFLSLNRIIVPTCKRPRDVEAIRVRELGAHHLAYGEFGSHADEDPGGAQVLQSSSVEVKVVDTGAEDHLDPPRRQRQVQRRGVACREDEADDARANRMRGDEFFEGREVGCLKLQFFAKKKRCSRYSHSRRLAKSSAYHISPGINDVLRALFCRRRMKSLFFKSLSGKPHSVIILLWCVDYRLRDSCLPPARHGCCEKSEFEEQTSRRENKNKGLVEPKKGKT